MADTDQGRRNPGEIEGKMTLEDMLSKEANYYRDWIKFLELKLEEAQDKLATILKFKKLINEGGNETGSVNEVRKATAGI